MALTAVPSWIVYTAVGLVDVKDVTAHVIRKPIASGEIREFPVFLIVGHRAWNDRASLQGCAKERG